MGLNPWWEDPAKLTGSALRLTAHLGQISETMLSWEALPLPTIRAHLVFLFKEHLQDLLCEKEEIKAPEHHCRLGDVIVFHGVETESLWTQENKMS